MGKENISGKFVPESATGRKPVLALHMPAGGGTAAVEAMRNIVLALRFSMEKVVLSCVGSDLSFMAENGAKVILKGYFAHQDHDVDDNDILFHLDGRTFTSREFFDVHPLAYSRAPDSGGLGEFAGVPDSFVQGVDRLGTLASPGISGDHAGPQAGPSVTQERLAPPFVQKASEIPHDNGQGGVAPVPDPEAGPGSGQAGPDPDVPYNGQGGVAPVPDPEAGPGSGQAGPDPDVPSSGGQKIIGDWSMVQDSSFMFNKNSDWLSSEPPSRDAPTSNIDYWQDYMFDIVTKNTGLSGWGAKPTDIPVINLLPVPEIQGANATCLYLKDCGEFNVSGAYKHDNLVIHEVFGLEVTGANQKSIKDQVDDILINIVGINADAAGLHAYNDYDWNLISRRLTSSGGEVSFGWSFKGGDAQYGDDAAFWILKDAATGQVIAGGLLAQGETEANGIASIQLPTGHAGEYVLTIGMMNVGSYNANQAKSNPHMLIGTVVQNEAYSADDCGQSSLRVSAAEHDGLKSAGGTENEVLCENFPGFDILDVEAGGDIFWMAEGLDGPGRIPDLGLAKNGTDTQDLSNLLMPGGTQDSLDEYLSVSSDGANSRLPIQSAERQENQSGGLHNAHDGCGGITEDTDMLLVQQILLNTGAG